MIVPYHLCGDFPAIFNMTGVVLLLVASPRVIYSVKCLKPSKIYGTTFSRNILYLGRAKTLLISSMLLDFSHG